MNIESISEARAIAREFHVMRNIVEWNRMFPHMQVKEAKKPRAGVPHFELKTHDPKSVVPWTYFVTPLEGVTINKTLFDEACQSTQWKQVSLSLGLEDGEVIDGLRDLAICCRTSDLERWFTKPLKLKTSKSPYAAKLRDLLPRVRHMASCLSLLR